MLFDHMKFRNAFEQLGMSTFDLVKLWIEYRSTCTFRYELYYQGRKVAFLGWDNGNNTVVMEFENLCGGAFNPEAVDIKDFSIIERRPGDEDFIQLYASIHKDDKEED